MIMRGYNETEQGDEKGPYRRTSERQTLLGTDLFEPNGGNMKRIRVWIGEMNLEPDELSAAKENFRRGGRLC